MSPVWGGVYPASEAVRDAARLFVRRWVDGGLGGGEDRDAMLLMRLNTLDQIAEEIAAFEMEAFSPGAAAEPGPVAARVQARWGVRLLLAQVAAWGRHGLPEPAQDIIVSARARSAKINAFMREVRAALPQVPQVGRRLAPNTPKTAPGGSQDLGAGAPARAPSVHQ